MRDVLVVEDHAPVGALGDTLRRAFATLPDPPVLDVAGVEGWPACGTPVEALRFHGLDGESLAARIAAVARRCACVSPLRDSEIVFVTNTLFTPVARTEPGGDRGGVPDESQAGRGRPDGLARGVVQLDSQRPPRPRAMGLPRGRGLLSLQPR